MMDYLSVFRATAIGVGTWIFRWAKEKRAKELRTLFAHMMELGVSPDRACAHIYCIELSDIERKHYTVYDLLALDATHLPG